MGKIIQTAGRNALGNLHRSLHILTMMSFSVKTGITRILT